MLVIDRFLEDVYERVMRIEKETGIEIRVIRFDRVETADPNYSRKKTTAIGISMEAS